MGNTNSASIQIKLHPPKGTRHDQDRHGKGKWAMDSVFFLEELSTYLHDNDFLIIVL